MSSNPNSNKPTKRQGRRNGQETRVSLLAAAGRILASQGSEALTIRGLTKAVGIKESSFYNHFESRDQLLDVLLEAFKNKVVTERFSEEELEALAETLDAEQVIFAYIRRFGSELEPLINDVARWLLMERFVSEKAKNLYEAHMVFEPEQYQARLFDILIKKGRLMACPSEDYAFMLNRLLLIWIEEYALSVNGLLSEDVVFHRLKRSLKLWLAPFVL